MIEAKYNQTLINSHKIKLICDSSLEHLIISNALDENQKAIAKLIEESLISWQEQMIPTISLS